MFQVISTVIVARLWVTRMRRGSPVRGHAIFRERVRVIPHIVESDQAAMKAAKK
jgi:hypothetical protein